MTASIKQQIEERGTRLSELWKLADAAIEAICCAQSVIIKDDRTTSRGDVSFRALHWKSNQGKWGIFAEFKQGDLVRTERIIHSPLIVKLMAVNHFAPLYNACHQAAADMAAFLQPAIYVMEDSLHLGPQLE